MSKGIVDLHDLYHLDNLELIAKQVVEGFIIGLHKSPFHGFSVEFAEHRIYNNGDPIKDIDWKVFGKTDRLYIKKFEEETNLRCEIILDTSSSMYYPEIKQAGDINKMRFSLIAAASIMHLLKNQRDAVGVTLFSDRIEWQVRARSHNIHHRLIMNNLEGLMDATEKNKRTNAAESIHHVAESVHKRSLVVIFSDMIDDLDNLEDIFASLQHLRYNKHEVILFHVVDKRKEFDFDFENRPYTFVDLETGEKVKLQPSQVKEHYTDQMYKFRKELKLKCAQYRIDFVEADIAQDYMQVLLAYLVKRKKMK
ncbi:MAG: DUF58 domain-containing protein [Bacteroidetes bacterium]|nr:DUF58 domain-containing protein [Bacteroidota bacterium]